MVVESKKDPADAKKGETAAWNWGGSRKVFPKIGSTREVSGFCRSTETGSKLSPRDVRGCLCRVEGEVEQVKDDKLTITSKGKQVSKDGSKDNPAVHVKRKGNDVVKRASELAVLDKEEDIPKGEKVMTRSQAAKIKEGKK